MKLVFRPEAEADLADIHDYIAEDSPSRAKEFITLLRRKCEPLCDHPRLGRARDDLRPGLRSFPVGRYLVIYRVREDAVEIVNFVQGSRDVDAMF